MKNSFQKFIITFAFLTISSIFSDDAAKVSFVVGKVSARSTSDSKAAWKQLKKDDLVNSGETIMTGNGSQVTLLYNGSEFKVAPNSTLVVKSLHNKDKDGEVEVSSGFAWFKLEKLGKKTFKATTPATTAGVRGTAFAALYDEKTKTAMNCICDGKVEVAGSAKSTMVSRGSGSVVKAGEEKVDIVSYKGMFEKKTGAALPTFEKKVQESPAMANCLSCHTPKGWTAPGILKDEKYGK
ncbi:MAG: FecR family protein [Leptospiraceae bacterium]|nr:FecR family protein [Leptospiraceae bacterium]